MKKRDKIIFWVATLWLALGMTSTGIVQLIKMEEEIAMMTRLGYPEYISTILGVWKLLGVIVILIPRFPLIKEWAYAGIFFNMSGAIFSHLIVGSDPFELFGPTLLIVLAMVSWYFRPPGRKLAQNLVQS
tara:strand:- start:121 stop:510 length:390 start_codon:yes stop_codon:yes gene_type:complete